MSRALLIVAFVGFAMVCGGLAATQMQRIVVAAIAMVVGMSIYIVRPIWMISLSLAVSPLLDEVGNQVLSGIGFNLASVVRGASIAAMLLTMGASTVQRSMPKSGLTWATIWLITPLCISLPLAVAPIFSLKQTLALAYWAIFAIYLQQKLKTRQDARMLIGGCFLTATVVIVTMAPYELHHVYSLYTDGSVSIYGAYGGGPFNLALSIAFWVPLCFVLQSRRQQIIYGVLCLCLLDILLHTFVRTAILVDLIYLVYAIVGQPSFRRLGVIIATGIIAIFLMFQSIQSGWLHRIHQSSTVDGFTSGRMQLYQVAVERFVHMSPVHKLLGIGFGNASAIMYTNGYALNTDPQNDFLNTLITAGLFGLIGLLVFQVMFFQYVRAIPTKRQRGVATTVYFTVLLTATINGIYSGESTAMVLALATIGLAKFYATSETTNADDILV